MLSLQQVYSNHTLACTDCIVCWHTPSRNPKWKSVKLHAVPQMHTDPKSGPPTHWLVPLQLAPVDLSLPARCPIMWMCTSCLLQSVRNLSQLLVMQKASTPSNALQCTVRARRAVEWSWFDLHWPAYILSATVLQRAKISIPKLKFFSKNSAGLICTGQNILSAAVFHPFLHRFLFFYVQERAKIFIPKVKFFSKSSTGTSKGRGCALTYLCREICFVTIYTLLQGEIFIKKLEKKWWILSMPLHNNEWLPWTFDHR